MNKADSFVQPIDNIGGAYGKVSWPGYVHLQPRESEGRPDLRHIGDDYNGAGGGNSDLGSIVKVIANGYVEKVIRWNGKYGFGNHVFVKHYLSDYLKKICGSDIIYSHYAHLDTFRCYEGQEVSKGQEIALLGNSGTRWAHLHLDIRKPTGRGYEDYPADKSIDWINARYFTPFLFIEQNREPHTEAPRNETPPQTGLGEGQGSSGETQQPIHDDAGNVQPSNPASDVSELQPESGRDNDVSGSNGSVLDNIPSPQPNQETTKKTWYSFIVDFLNALFRGWTK